MTLIRCPPNPRVLDLPVSGPNGTGDRPEVVEVTTPSWVRQTEVILDRESRTGTSVSGENRVFFSINYLKKYDSTIRVFYTGKNLVKTKIFPPVTSCGFVLPLTTRKDIRQGFAGTGGGNRFPSWTSGSKGSLLSTQTRRCHTPALVVVCDSSTGE